MRIADPPSSTTEATASARRSDEWLNDVHSRLSATRVARVLRPTCASELAAIVTAAREQGVSICASGGRHAMGRQPFVTDGWVLDLRGLDRILDLDRERGWIVVEAGVQWPELLVALRNRQRGEPRPWGIRQKQTGADSLTIGGAVAANVHGRGLRYAPFVEDVESLRMIDWSGRVRELSRQQDPERFALVCGGYGLFGVVTDVTLRLRRRARLERRVERIVVEELSIRVAEEIARGAEYGDFQFAIDPNSEGFLRDGVFTHYHPVDGDLQVAEPSHALSTSDFHELLRLAHVDKRRGFERYVAHYLATDGQHYDSDTHQLSSYPEGYHTAIDRELGHVGSEMITELYVPRPALAEFMREAARVLRDPRAEVIYGTVRFIERDSTSALAWARQPYATVVFNLHVEHSPVGIASAAAAFRALIDAALALDGSYYLTYHGFARAAQIRAAYPEIDRFIAAKRALDPDSRFGSEWWRAITRELGAG